MSEDEQGGDVWDKLIRKLESSIGELQALEAPLARRLRTGAHDDLADMLGVAPQELDEAFLSDEDDAELPLAKRIRTGIGD